MARTWRFLVELSVDDPDEVLDEGQAYMEAVDLLVLDPGVPAKAWTEEKS